MIVMSAVMVTDMTAAWRRWELTVLMIMLTTVMGMAISITMMGMINMTVMMILVIIIHSAITAMITETMMGTTTRATLWMIVTALLIDDDDDDDTY